jgi:hypothetical protein
MDLFQGDIAGPKKNNLAWGTGEGNITFWEYQYCKDQDDFLYYMTTIDHSDFPYVIG